jgi:DNA ligase-4
MILKTHFSDTLPERLTLKSFHFLLPHLLLFQNSFEAAVTLLSSEPIIHFPPRPEIGYARDLGKIALHHLIPKIGIKIGRPEYIKARSIKHCCNMVGQRRMSVERKYDGEYCQIHIDLSKQSGCIQIFSKSGKDSTSDRAGVHQAIRESLRIGRDDCRFKQRCILEGELLAWSHKHKTIMPFHKLRKLVSRSGVFIGTESDSPPQPYECLMMVFFDILVLDDNILLRKPHRERRLLLKNTVQIISGVSDIADQRIIDFSRSDGQAKLETLFSKGIAERWEGFILKGCEDPYFPILVEPGVGCEGRWIKLKKDYIPGLGDTVDLVLVGAAYNARDATMLGLAKKETWTHFFVGCLENKEAVLQSNTEPRFRIIDVIDQHGISRANMQNLNSLGKYSARSVDPDDGVIIGDIRPGMPTIDVVFKTPFVVEVMGSGFEKPSGARYYTIRFPRILKIHSDRSIEDAASFRELQVLAETATSVPSEELLDEEAEWTNRVRSGTSKPGFCPDESQSVSTVSSPASAKAIPIYIDRSLSSSNGSPGSNVLANNGNLSSQRNARKRKASPSASESCAKNTYGGLDSAQLVTKVVDPALVVTSSARYLATKEGPPRSDHTSTDIKIVSASERKADSDEPSRSPLTKIPIYIHPGSASKVQPTFTGLSNVSHTLEEFLHMLNFEGRRLKPEKSNLFPASENITLGIMFANISRDPLGPILLELSKHISNAFTASPCSHNPKGRIFLLNSNFLNLVVDWKNHIFCLRKTWDKISRVYFYACIAWDIDKCRLSRESVDQFPSTPLDAEHPIGNSTVTTTTRRTQPSTALRRSLVPVSTFVPVVRISFDRKQVLVLGEFSSIRPLVRVVPSLDNLRCSRDI